MSAMSKSSSSSPDEITATIGLRSEKRHFTCRLEKVTQLVQCEQLIEDQQFEFKMGASIGLPTTWAFYLQMDDEEDKSIGAYFKLVTKPEGVKNVYVSYKMALKKGTGTGDFLNEDGDCTEMTDSDWGFNNLFEAADLPDLVQADGSLLIDIHFELFSSVEHLDLAGKVEAFQDKFVKQLSEDMRQIRVIKDVNAKANATIISKDNQEFLGNRGILAARSAVFQRMFQAEMTESVTGVVRIDDLSGKTVNVLLDYICTGTLHQDWKSLDVIEELTSAAHRYELHLLTAFLDDVLGMVCTKENVMRLAILARTLGMKKAEMELLDFVKMNATNLEDLMVEPMKRTCENCGEEAE